MQDEGRTKAEGNHTPKTSIDLWEGSSNKRDGEGPRGTTKDKRTENAEVSSRNNTRRSKKTMHKTAKYKAKPNEGTLSSQKERIPPTSKRTHRTTSRQKKKCIDL
jgi:hypothetical protein